MEEKENNKIQYCESIYNMFLSFEKSIRNINDFLLHGDETEYIKVIYLLSLYSTVLDSIKKLVYVEIKEKNNFDIDDSISKIRDIIYDIDVVASKYAESITSPELNVLTHVLFSIYTSFIEFIDYSIENYYISERNEEDDL